MSDENLDYVVTTHLTREEHMALVDETDRVGTTTISQMVRRIIQAYFHTQYGKQP